MKEQNDREAGETIRHSRGNGVLMFFVAAFSHLHRVDVDHRAGFKVLGITLARLPLVPGHIDMGTRLLR